MLTLIVKTYIIYVLHWNITYYNLIFSLPIYKTDPVLILVVNSIIYNNNEQHWQCTKLSWTKERGHKYDLLYTFMTIIPFISHYWWDMYLILSPLFSTIAAGFSNGYIALWDLTEESPLLKQKQNDSLVINAFSHFFAHDSAVSSK